LLRFATSPEFREGFEGVGKELGQAFSAYARRSLREEPDEAVATSLAFETWLQESPPPPARPVAPGKVGLADGLVVRSFPVDLSELQFAAQTLKRHLAARAWATEKVELSGLESLRQVARRAPPGPWMVAVRGGTERLAAVGLSRELSAVVQAAAKGETWQQLQAETPAYSAASLRTALELGLIQVGR
jgi:hypothetical protein